MSYAVNLCKQFGSRSGLRFCQSWPGSKLIKCWSWSEFKQFVTLSVFLKELFGEKWNKSVEDNKIIRIFNYTECKYRNFYLWPLQIQNGHIHVYCINMYVKIYPNESGYNYYYNECCFFSYQNSINLRKLIASLLGFFCFNSNLLGFHYYWKILFDAELL